MSNSVFLLSSPYMGDSRETAYRPRRCNRLKTHRCALPSFHTASAKEEKKKSRHGLADLNRAINASVAQQADATASKAGKYRFESYQKHQFTLMV